MELFKQCSVMGASLPCAFFILIICTNSVITAETHHKRSLQGFQGVRGKRSIEEVSTQNKQEGFENNHQILVVTTTEQNFLDNEVRGPELLRDLPPLSVVKRAPMGFMGMRGKKEYEYTGMDKKALQGFHGVRGKKILLKIPHRFVPKRAPSGFMGMRGKKKLLMNEYGANKRAPSGFMGMRGKKEDFNPLYSSANIELDDSNSIDDFGHDFYEKLQNERRLLNEFGRIYGLDTQLPNEFSGERASEVSSEEDDGTYGWMNDEAAESQEDQNGYFGMRNKKDVSDMMSEEKRAPNAGFFGMRGKKAPMSTGFFGTRGKKGPFEFRGKFVGVRGKKIPDGSPLRRLAMELSELHPELESAALMGSESNKRAPSGFQGLRGKKWTDSSNEE
ncbi:tachykinins isoform X2 [Bradysia coprophila]|uniref:tachykinins isoform X2 n=1 Tax=Bradysia coprophila TaxID=38358 RepID=UPI00187DBFC2|nr:tachykinins isoform X2 [Bradysia coprophila]